jgi:GST-like protein
LGSFPHLKRLLDEISARPAAQRTATLKDRYAFKAEMDEEARRHMFRHRKRRPDDHWRAAVLAA